MRTISPRYGRVLAAFALWVYGLATSSDLFPIALTFPTFVLALLFLHRDRSDKFNFSDIFWLCSLLFFVVAPCQNISDFSFLHGAVRGIEYSPLNFLLAELIVLIALTCFSLSVGRQVFSMQAVVHGRPAKISTTAVATLISATSFLLYLRFSGGLENALAPRLLKDREQISFLSVQFLSFQTICLILIAGSLAEFQIRISTKFIITFSCFLLVSTMLLISVNPLNSARFFIVATWLPVALALTKKKAKYYHFYGMLVLGVILVMPFMSLSTRGGIEALSDFASSNYAVNLWLLKDMDVFDTLVHATKLYSERALGGGLYSLAILLFFVPRAIWPTKPVVAGLVVGEDLYINHLAGTANLSFFFAGDFYFDLWLPGVVIGSVGLGLLVKVIARSSLLNPLRTNITSLVLIGSAPILLRGPLGAVVGYFVSLIAACFVLNAIFSGGKFHSKGSAPKTPV